ncbi:MAG TPA: cell envelope integrity protein TolA [Telluria sp.]|nr:cell envelope integrity protein TolA [Telluria sp.]
MPEMKPATAGAPYSVPPEPRRGPAIVLAVAMHAMLLGFLWIGVSWQRSVPIAVEAEVWDMKVQSAAAPLLPPEAVEPEPEPERQPEPEPIPKVIPPPVEEPVAPKAPDIALEREKRKAEQLQKEAVQRELIEQKKRDEARERDRAEKKKLEDEKKAKEAEKKLADKKLADKLAADKKKADQLAKAKEAKEAAALAKSRDDEMKRLMGAAGTSGSAVKSTAPRNDASYQAALTAKIKSTTTYAGSTDVPGNPRAEFRIEQLPTGEIISVKKVKSSGVPSFDDAVEKGIIKSSPLPKKKDGTVERSVLIGFSMKDLD